MNIVIFLSLSLCSLALLSSCQKENCRTCYQSIGGFAGTEIHEEREVCSDSEAEALEASSQSTTVWHCEEVN